MGSFAQIKSELSQISKEKDQIEESLLRIEERFRSEANGPALGGCCLGPELRTHPSLKADPNMN